MQSLNEESGFIWHVGDRLMHPVYGIGEVVRIFGTGNKLCIAVKFATDGTKIIAAHFASVPSLLEIAQVLEEQEAELAMLEKASKLEKRYRKYKQFDPVETWMSLWIASPIAYLFPEERREEWLGDLYELHREMLYKGYPRWLVNLIDLGRTVILIVSACQIKLSDFFSVGARKRE